MTAEASPTAGAAMCEPGRVSRRRALALAAAIPCEAVRGRAAASPSLAARVNGRAVTTAELEEVFRFRRLQEYGPGRRADPERDRALRAFVLYRIVEDLLMAQRAEALGLVVDRAAVEAHVGGMRRAYGTDRFDADLRRAGVPVVRVRELARRHLLGERLLDRLSAEEVGGGVPGEASPSAPPLEGRKREEEQRLAQRAMRRQRLLSTLRARAKIEQFVDVGVRIK